jgi:DNA repair exonuclease SbcCD ATPase subunit
MQGFKSVVEKLTLDLTSYTKGLYFITGENKSQPRLGSNGVGKSTILPDALCWCIFGKTTRAKVKAGNIVNWSNSVKCFVEIIFDKNGEEHVVKRTQSPNSLTLDGKTVTESYMEDFIGIPYEPFLYKAVIGQFSNKFFDLKPSEKLKVFSNLLDLDMWDACSSRAKTKSDSINAKLQGVEDRLLRISGKVSQLESASYKGDIDLFEAELDKNIAKNEAEKAKESANLITKQDAIEKLKLSISVLDKKCKEKVPDTKKLNDEIEELYKRQREYADKKTAANTLLCKAKLEISKLSGLHGTCSRCNQIITKEHIDKEIELHNESKDNLLQEILYFSEHVAKYSTEIAYKKAEQKIIVDEYSKLLDNKKTEEYILTSKINSLAMTKNNIKMLDKIIRNFKKADNPFVKKEKERAVLLLGYKKQESDLNDKVVKLKTEYNINYFWVKGFKEIKLTLVKDAIAELTMHISNNLVKAGLEGWKVSISINRTLSTGDTKSEFTVLVQSPTNQHLVPFECWSGGEGQRLKIAGTMGLQDLITSRFGFDSNIEVWDEATAWMSKEGIADFMEILRERADELNKLIFVIDNRDLHTYGNFKDTLRLVHDSNGTRIDVH